MRWSQQPIHTLRENPADAEIPSHALMVRAGLIRKIAPGLYSYGPLVLKSIRKVEAIIRDELSKVSCSEILMPMVQPKELWEETNRWTEMGEGLLKFKNRNNHDFCLGATHEEIITDYIRREVKSYRDLPRSYFQVQTKYRDEIRPRFGLMRGREFIMKDAYSFDVDKASAQKSYEKMYQSYENIFNRLGLNYAIVQADTGSIGGDQSHEFQVLADSGEDHLMVCESADYAANVEIAPVGVPANNQSQEELLEIEELATPGLKTIEDLSRKLDISKENLVKTLFFKFTKTEKKSEKIINVAVLLRGCDELNFVKLKKVLGLEQEPEMLTDDEVKKLTGAEPGSCGPVNLGKEIDVPIYMDQFVAGMKNYIVGSNADGLHLKNVNHGRDYKPTQVVDLKFAIEGDICPVGDGGEKNVYKSIRGIEVGHIFYLGQKYSQAMKAEFLNKEGRPSFVEMGCYGIGVSRTVQAAIEQNHDENGIVWPKEIAPFDLHICLLDPDKEKISDYTLKLYDDLTQKGVEVFLDDRLKERPGIKFKDADLLGLPWRLNIGRRGFENDEIELVNRKTGEKQTLSTKDVLAEVCRILGVK